MVGRTMGGYSLILVRQATLLLLAVATLFKNYLTRNLAHCGGHPCVTVCVGSRELKLSQLIH
jgi:hypothetical protein